MKVIVNKMHHTCKPEEIVKYLRKWGYKLIEAIYKLQYKSKKPLNMFMLVFRHDENVNKIYEIRHIIGIRVQFLHLRKFKLVPQCKRCQAIAQKNHAA